MLLLFDIDSGGEGNFLGGEDYIVPLGPNFIDNCISQSGNRYS